MLKALAALALSLTAATCAAQTIPIADAKVAFADAQQVCAADNGKLWGKLLCGPMIFVDPTSRFAVANQNDVQGVLHARDGLFTGVLPASLPVANTATDWSGVRWTMVLWPLPQNARNRKRLLAHEMFHRIQSDLGIPLASPQIASLDTLDGRYWLQLEWRALATALLASSNDASTHSAQDALAFRARRHALFPADAASESALNLNEGLAEYTGTKLAYDDASAAWTVVSKIARATDTPSFVRSFAYTSGPAYALLLDRFRPSWRHEFLQSKNADLGDLLAHAIGSPANQVAAGADSRAAIYGGTALREAEVARAQQLAAKLADYRVRFVDAPTLTLPNVHWNFSFDPNGLVPLPGEGTVYSPFEASDDWGTLKADAALVSGDFHELRVAAPKSSRPDDDRILRGDGYTLTLSPQWELTPGTRAGDLSVKKKRD